MKLPLALLCLVVSASGAFAQPAAPQRPPVVEAVSVSARDTEQIERATRSIAHSDDPFMARLGDRLESLAMALARGQASGQVFMVGPLTDSERAAVDLDSYFTDYQRPTGNIRILIRRSWTELGPVPYIFDVPSLLACLAALVKGPIVQVTALQKVQQLFVGRMVLELNYQVGTVIPQALVYRALAGAFKDKRVGDRLLAVVGKMEAQGGTYDLVPPDKLEEFRKRAEPGFIVPAHGQTGTLTIRYGEEEYSVWPADLIWSCLRLSAGDESKDWAEKESARKRANLGRDVIDYLEAQVKAGGLLRR